MISFAALFPDRDYAHQLSLRRGDLQHFFAPTTDHLAILEERRRWLSESAENYAGALQGSEPFIDETSAMLRSIGALNESDLPEIVPPGTGCGDARANQATDSGAMHKMVALGGRIEPDIVLLEKQSDGIFKVVAGCVCFPSSWNFAEKLGKPLDVVHQVVPELNQSIGIPMARFLDKLEPGASWQRSNWGLSASAERNQHPVRQLASLRLPLALDRVWLRVEEQILSILPATRALLFGIRIVMIALDELRRREPSAIPHFRRALATMPEAMARYKNIEQVRTEIIDLLSIL
jgi:hypothetical protein